MIIKGGRLIKPFILPVFAPQILLTAVLGAIYAAEDSALASLLSTRKGELITRVSPLLVVSVRAGCLVAARGRAAGVSVSFVTVVSQGALS